MSLQANVVKYLPAVIRTRLEGHPALYNILANTGWLAVDKILRMGVGLFVGVWVARYLGPVQFGALNYALAFGALFGSFAALGLDAIVVRDLVSDPASKEVTLGTAFALRQVAGVITWGCIIAAISLVRPDDSLSRWLVAIVSSTFFFRGFDVVDFWFQSQVQSKFLIWAYGCVFVIVALLKVVLILLKAPLIAFAGTIVAESALGTVGAVLIYHLRGFSVKAWHASLSRAKVLLGEGWPLIFSGLMIMLYMRIDQVMLGQMVGDDAVGIFSAAVRFSEIGYIIPTIIASSILPAIVKSKESGEHVYQQRIQKYYDLNACLAYLFSIPMTLMSPYIVSFLYGDAYKGAATILAIHIWSSIFVFLGVARWQYLVTEGFLKFSLIATILGAGTNITLNFFLIPKYHGVGAAMATVCSQFVSAFLSSFFYRPLVQTGLMQTKSLFAPIRYLAFYRRRSSDI
jgi:PST family polysaccharide transporter